MSDEPARIPRPHGRPRKGEHRLTPTQVWGKRKEEGPIIHDPKPVGRPRKEEIGLRGRDAKQLRKVEDEIIEKSHIGNQLEKPVLIRSSNIHARRVDYFFTHLRNGETIEQAAELAGLFGSQMRSIIFADSDMMSKWEASASRAKTSWGAKCLEIRRRSLEILGGPHRVTALLDRVLNLAGTIDEDENLKHKVKAITDIVKIYKDTVAGVASPKNFEEKANAALRRNFKAVGVGVDRRKQSAYSEVSDKPPMEKKSHGTSSKTRH